MGVNLSDYKNNLPGTILKDIEFFLNFIGENYLEITGNKGLLPNHCMPLINENMSHPLKLKLKREQQMSYPHISGLYLISRTLGLIEITQNKSKRYLTLNQNTFDRWKKLNPTEQYFTLICSWFFRSDERLINSGRTYLYGTFYNVLHFLKKLDETLVLKNSRDQMWKIKITGACNLALLEMCGMIIIEDTEGFHEKSWSISSISSTKFESDFLSFFTDQNDPVFDILSNEDEEENLFYEKIKVFFPELKNLLTREKRITNNGTYFFKIYLTKKIWRRINIQGSESLDCLAITVLDAFEFDNDHMYQFSYTDRFGVLKTVHHVYADEPPSAEEINIGDLDILIGDTIEFLFDFGDYWKFSIQLEKIDEQLITLKPCILESIGIAPQQYAY